MRIVVTTRSFDHLIGGMETHTRALVAYLQQQGHEVTILTPELGSKKAIFELKGVNIHRLGRPPHELVKYSLSFWGKVRSYLTNHRGEYDFILNISMGIGYPFGWPKDLTSITTTVLHGTYNQERQTLHAGLKRNPTSLRTALGIPYTYIFDRVLQFVISRSGRIIVVSDGVKESLLQHYKANAAHITVVKNFVDTDLFAFKLRSFNKPTQLVYSSRVHPEKGILLLLETLKLLKQDDIKHAEQLHLTVIGDGPAMIQAKQFVKDANLSNVSFLGRLKPAEISEQLQRGSIFVFPTLRSEGLPLSLLEAMSTGLPVVASDVSGVNELIENEKTGLLFKPGDTSHLLHRIKYALYDAKLNNLSKSARQIVIENHDAKKQLGIIEKIILRK